jgi:hypothetical protein
MKQRGFVIGASAIALFVAAGAFLMSEHQAVIAAKVSDTTMVILTPQRVLALHACNGYRFGTGPTAVTGHSWLSIPLTGSGPSRTPSLPRSVLLDTESNDIAWPAIFRKPLSESDRVAMLQFIGNEPSTYIDWYDDHVTLSLFRGLPTSCDPWTPFVRRA